MIAVVKWCVSSRYSTYVISFMSSPLDATSVATNTGAAPKVQKIDI